MEVSIHSIAFNLVSKKGHLFPYHSAVGAACKKLALNHTVWLSDHYKMQEIPEGWYKHFSSKDLLKPKLWQQVRRGLDFFRLFRKKERGVRVFFLESFNTTDYLALAFAALFLKRVDRLWILFRYLPSFYPLQGKIHRIVTHMLQRLLKKRLYLTTDSELLRSAWEKEGVVCTLLPIPHTPSYSENKVSLQCWWPGEPREAKGASKIASLLHSQDPIAEQFQCFISEEFSGVGFRPLPKELSEKDYQQMLQTSQFVLLPYDPQVYAASTSGIFVEAVCAGAIPIVTKGTWMAYELKKYQLDELIVDWEPSLFFSRLAHLSKRKDLLEKLEKMRQDYQKWHSIDSYANVLKTFFNNSSYAADGRMKAKANCRDDSVNNSQTD